MSLPSDLDFFAKIHSPTKKVYRDQYPAIDPTSKLLSQAGKIVMITGAGKGLGKMAFATAFAKAGARAIILTSRSRSSLSDTAKHLKLVNPDVETMMVEMETTSESSVAAAFEQIRQSFGIVDVLVNNAGVMDDEQMLKQSSPSSWWQALVNRPCSVQLKVSLTWSKDVNVRGTLIVTQHFLQLLGQKKGTLINVTSGASVSVVPSISSYCISKLANLQLAAFVAAENANVTAVSLNPGIVVTDMVTDMFRPYAKDTPELPGGVAVWLSSPAAEFMDGRYMSANWNVQELMEKQDEIKKLNQLTINLVGDFSMGEVATK